MTDPDCLVDRAFLSDVALDLLSSSTMARFARLAIVAGTKYLIENLSTIDGHGGATKVLQRAQVLWDRFLAEPSVRDEGEVELAILLAAMTVAGTPGIDDLISGLVVVLRDRRRELAS